MDFEPKPPLKKWPTSSSELDLLRERLNPNDRTRFPKDWSQKVGFWKKCDQVLILRVHRGFFLSMGVNDWNRFEEVIFLTKDDQSPNAEKNEEPYASLMTVEINMAHHRNWWQRLKTGIKYIFCRKVSNYGDYAEILLNEENVRNLKDLCELHISDLERNRKTDSGVYDKLFEEYNEIKK